MSRYTLNLSEICGVITGMDTEETTGNPFDYIEDIIDTASPLLFSSRLNVYDNADDRDELYHKIIEHYWEYEVCTTTPNDFIRRLNRKMNEVMPYYNQRYESLKKEFDPFIDVDYTTNRESAAHNITVDDNNTDQKHTGTDKDNTTHRGQDETVAAHTGDDTVKNDITFDTERNENNTSVLDGETSSTNTRTENGTTTVDNDTTGRSVTNETDTDVIDTDTSNTIKRTENGTTTVDQDTTLSKSGTSASTSTGSTSDHITDTAGGTSWDLYNDTPQGSINGITDLNYLTRYEKHTKEGPTNTRAGTQSTSNNTNGTTTDSETGALDSTTTVNNTINETQTGTVDTTDTKTIESTVNTTGTSDTTTTDSKTIKDNGATTTDNTTTDTKALTGSDTTDGTSKTTYNNTMDTTVTLGTDYNTDHIYDSNVNTKTDNNSDFTHEGTDDSHIRGKMNSGRTYAEMLTIWRESMINLDMEVIEALHPLFFLIY